MTIDISSDKRCKHCAYFVSVYDGVYDLKKVRVNPSICYCDYWTKTRRNGLNGDV